MIAWDKRENWNREVASPSCSSGEYQSKRFRSRCNYGTWLLPTYHHITITFLFLKWWNQKKCKKRAWVSTKEIFFFFMLCWQTSLPLLLHKKFYPGGTSTSLSAMWSNLMKIKCCIRKKTETTQACQCIATSLVRNIVGKNIVLTGSTMLCWKSWRKLCFLV